MDYILKVRNVKSVVWVELESQAKGLCRLKPGTDYVFDPENGKFAVLYFEES